MTRHWKEYAIEAALLGAFMVSATTLTILLEHPASPVHALLPVVATRRSLMGIGMGLTAAAIIYSPWGRRSGAHMNPAVTLTFLRLGKVRAADAMAYVGSQFLGGVLGIAAASVAFAPWISDAHVNYVATLPGPSGAGPAFAAEAVISFVMMLFVLATSNHLRLARFTGVVVALLVATFITLETPLSGMSMNPARSLGPDVVGAMWRGLWIYFLAPPLGMLVAAETFVGVRGYHAIRCAKLHHDDGPCIFNCGFRAEDPGRRLAPGTALRAAHRT
jgi:aquaporin Z